MLTQIINGKIFTPQGWLDEGSVLIRDNKILEVTNCDLALIGAKLIDAKGMYIVPGYVCMHAHGGGGHDFNECTEEAFRAAIKAHQKHGATSIFPTLSSSPFSEIRKAVTVCETLMNEKDSPVLGLHVEGPYLNPKRAGEQFAGKLKNPDKEEYTSLLESTDCIKRWDASPELPGALEFARYLKSKGILVAVSHTESEYEGIKAAFEAGFTHTAHFYNGMPGFHKCREYKYEGTVESVYLTDGMTIELIADGIHLPATILRLAYKLKGVEKTCLVTDALAYAAADGMEITDPNVIIEDGVCKMADHSSLAGSIATMDILVRTMVKAGIPLADAVRHLQDRLERMVDLVNVFGEDVLIGEDRMLIADMVREIAQELAPLTTSTGVSFVIEGDRDDLPPVWPDPEGTARGPFSPAICSSISTGSTCRRWSASTSAKPRRT